MYTGGRGMRPSFRKMLLGPQRSYNLSRRERVGWIVHVSVLTPVLANGWLVHGRVHHAVRLDAGRPRRHLVTCNVGRRRKETRLDLFLPRIIGSKLFYNLVSHLVQQQGTAGQCATG